MSPEQTIAYALEGQATKHEHVASTVPDALPAGLSAREVEVLKLVARGLTNALGSQRPLHKPQHLNRHLNSVYRKIGASSRAAATRFAAEHRLA
jgi:DNA-binding CsgD family transcriptional regulator